MVLTVTGFLQDIKKWWRVTKKYTEVSFLYLNK